MPNLPSDRSGQLAWFQSHIEQWIDNSGLIGLTGAEMTSFKALIEDAAMKKAAADAARESAKSATSTYYQAHRAMLEPGRAYIATIKAYAARTNDPAVYELANLDPNSPATPATPPTAPFDVDGSVNPNGLVTLTWDADRSGASSGIFFIVARQRSGEPAFTVLGASAEKTYIDPAANVCDGPVSYQIRAQRGLLFSDWTLPVTFTLATSGPTLMAEGMETRKAA